MIVLNDLWDLVNAQVGIIVGWFFFFSSRRRHTRYIGDWSSDVCSSDLDRASGHSGKEHFGWEACSAQGCEVAESRGLAVPTTPRPRGSATSHPGLTASLRAEIGRASCRERA